MNTDDSSAARAGSTAFTFGDNEELCNELLGLVRSRMQCPRSVARTRHSTGTAHQPYFERNGGFDSKMMLVCERFRLVHDYCVQSNAMKPGI